MHMLVGFLLTRLLKGAHSTAGLLPRIPGKFEAVHQLPGRIRFRIPLLEGLDTEAFDALKAELARISAIQLVDLNAISGSLVLEYDDQKVDASIICGILLKLLGLQADLDNQPQSLARQELNLIGSSLDRMAYDSTRGVVDLNTALALTILGLGLYKIIIQQDRNMPGGFSLLWWAYVIFKSGNR